mgnify:CR=1 FL=1
MPSVIRSGVRPNAGSGSTNEPPASALSDGELRRGTFCALYNEGDLTPNMRSKVSDAFAAFRKPKQDPSKVQLFDPDRATKRLGGGKLGAPRVARPLSTPALQFAPAPPPTEEETVKHDPLQLWLPTEVPVEEGEPGAAPPPSTEVPIEVDPHLCRWLRPHQREGVQFLFDCTMGLRDFEGEVSCPRQPTPTNLLLISPTPQPHWFDAFPDRTRVAFWPTIWDWERRCSRSRSFGPSCARASRGSRLSRTPSLPVRCVTLMPCNVCTCRSGAEGDDRGR